MNHEVKTRGFTLIELMLAMTFISILLLTIALTIVQIANIYNRGTITKELNASSRSISTDLDHTLRASGSFSLEPAANRYVSKTWGGRLCTGQYSYIWNYGSALSSLDPSRNQYSGPATAGNTVVTGGITRYEISLVKAPDAGAIYCTPNGSGGYPNVSPVGAVELLRTGDHGLVLHYFDVTTAPTAKDVLSSQELYKMTYVLGTNDLDALTGATDQLACKGPGEDGADLNYCDVQKFTIVLRVVSGVN